MGPERPGMEEERPGIEGCWGRGGGGTLSSCGCWMFCVKSKSTWLGDMPKGVAAFSCFCCWVLDVRCWVVIGFFWWGGRCDEDTVTKDY